MSGYCRKRTTQEVIDEILPQDSPQGEPSIDVQPCTSSVCDGLYLEQYDSLQAGVLGVMAWSHARGHGIDEHFSCMGCVAIQGVRARWQENVRLLYESQDICTQEHVLFFLKVQFQRVCFE